MRLHALSAHITLEPNPNPELNPEVHRILAKPFIIKLTVMLRYAAQIPGLNAPIPPGTEFGYAPGQWGKPPVDESGIPLYGDVFGEALGEESDDEQERCCCALLSSC